MARRRGATRREAAVWASALRRAALDTVAAGPDKGQRKIDIIARRLVQAALAGDMQAIAELGNRLDGKPLPVTQEPDAPVAVVYSWGEPVADDPAPEAAPVLAGDPVRRLR